jgi:hypothetical protein
MAPNEFLETKMSSWTEKERKNIQQIVFNVTK